MRSWDGFDANKMGSGSGPVVSLARGQHTRHTWQGRGRGVSASPSRTAPTRRVDQRGLVLLYTNREIMNNAILMQFHANHTNLDPKTTGLQRNMVVRGVDFNNSPRGFQIVQILAGMFNPSAGSSCSVAGCVGNGMHPSVDLESGPLYSFLRALRLQPHLEKVIGVGARVPKGVPDPCQGAHLSLPSNIGCGKSPKAIRPMGSLRPPGVNGLFMGFLVANRVSKSLAVLSSQGYPGLFGTIYIYT